MRNNSVSLDTLKKISSRTGFFPHSEVFWQLFPRSRVGSSQQIVWTAFFTVKSHFTGQKILPRYRTPEAEWLCRMAGVFNWEKALGRMGVKEDDHSLVLAGVFPAKEFSVKKISLLLKEAGLTIDAGPWGQLVSIPENWSNTPESFTLERSALSEVE